MSQFDDACAALVTAHPDLAPPRVLVSELPSPRLGMNWAVKMEVADAKDSADRSRAVVFLNDWIERNQIRDTWVVVDGCKGLAWLLIAAEQEDRLGPLLPHGFGGGAVPIRRARLEQRLSRDELMRWQDDGGKTTVGGCSRERDVREGGRMGHDRRVREAAR